MSRAQRLASLGAQGAGLLALGFGITGASSIRALPDFLHPPTNEETRHLARAAAASAGASVMAVEDFIDASWVAQAARRQPSAPSAASSSHGAGTVVESRPQLKIHPAHARRSLTAGALNGEGRTTVPPVVWTKREVGGVGGVGDGADTTGKGTMTSVWHIGSDVCGPTGHVHDGYVATMLDEGLARCCIGLLPHRVALTAELRIDYVAPVPAEAFVVLRAETTRIVGRKAWVEGRLETLEEEGVQPRVLARATALFVSPKSAGALATLYPVT